MTMATIVNGILLRGGKVLMARRTPTRQAYPDTWSFPGGHVEAGETLIAALHRELLEEIGVNVTSAIHEHQVEDPSAGPLPAATFHFFVVHAWDGEPRNLGNEHSALRWVDLRDAVRLPDLALTCYPGLFAGLLAK